MTKLPLNPYIAGNPLRIQEGFFGRKDTLEWVTRELRNPTTNALVLSGQRRIGKTSLLLQLMHYLPKEEYFPVYFDLQNQSTKPLGKALADLADKAAERAGLEPPKPESFDNQGRFFQRNFIPQLYQVLQKDCRPVFLLDEFDVLDQGTQAELAESVAAKALFPFLRQLMEDPRPAFIFVVGRQVDDLTIDFHATFKTSLKREVWLLDAESVEKLVRQAETNGTLSFQASAVQHIFELTHGHPYLTQLLCQRIWQRAYSSDPISVPLIQSSDVEAAVSDTLEVGEAALTWLWNGLGLAEKIYAAALAEITQKDELISKDRVMQVITANARRLRNRDVERAPLDLVKRNVLEQNDEHEYRFAVAIFQQWIKRYKPLRVVKDEIDRIEPVAERLFLLGRDFYERRLYDDAIRYFKEALQQNESHFKARLNLGDALLELDKVPEAIDELERAYKLDPLETHLSLARALIIQARIYIKANDENKCLEACERALIVSPSELEAQEIRKDIWSRRGDAALKQGDYREAKVAYEQINDIEGISKAEKYRKDIEIQQTKSKIEALIKSEAWDQAFASVEQAQVDYPEISMWEAYVPEIRAQNRLKKLYLQAEKQLESNQPTEAIKLLLEIMYRQSDYKDAPYWILKATKKVDARQLQEQLRKIESQNSSLVAENNQLKKSKSELEKQVIDLRKVDTRQLQEQIKSIESKYRSLVSENDQLKKSKSELENQVHDLRDVISQNNNHPPLSLSYDKISSWGLLTGIIPNAVSYQYGDDDFRKQIHDRKSDLNIVLTIGDVVGSGTPKKVMAIQVIFKPNKGDGPDFIPSNPPWSDLNLNLGLISYLNSMWKPFYLLSEYAYSNTDIKNRLSKLGGVFLAEAEGKYYYPPLVSTQAHFKITELEYGSDSSYNTHPRSYFKKITFEFMWGRKK